MNGSSIGDRKNEKFRAESYQIIYSDLWKSVPGTTNTLEVCADIYGEIDESDERDNCTSTTFTVPNNNAGGTVSGCFLPGTLVEAENGAVAIDQITPGMKVWSVSGSGKTELQEVTKTLHAREGGYYQVLFSEGALLNVTPLHRFYDPMTKSYRAIRDIAIGDWVSMMLGSLNEGGSLYDQTKPVQLISKTFVNREVDVYNITVEKNANYFVEGILVHNEKVQPVDPNYCSTKSCYQMNLVTICACGG